MAGVKQMLAEANAAVRTVSVEEAKAMLGRPDVAFIDVRETAELQQTGRIPGAEHAPRGLLEFRADPESPAHNPAFSSGKTLVAYCASGGRSALAAKTLKDMGVKDAVNMAGGMTAWKQSGGPTE